MEGQERLDGAERAKIISSPSKLLPSGSSLIADSDIFRDQSSQIDIATPKNHRGIAFLGEKERDEHSFFEKQIARGNIFAPPNRSVEGGGGDTKL